MNFSDLYRYAEQLDRSPVGFDFLRGKVIAHHDQIGRVDVLAVNYPQPTGQAYFRHGEPDRTSAYDEEFEVAEIVICDTLQGEEAELRFALTKELMHVFDNDEERVNTREKFITLIHEIQNGPLPTHASLMYQSDLMTRWMALLVLCPKRFRDMHIADFRASKLAPFDIAAMFEIPEWTVPYIMDDYYDTVHAEFVGKR